MRAMKPSRPSRTTLFLLLWRSKSNRAFRVVTNIRDPLLMRLSRCLGSHTFDIQGFRAVRFEDQWTHRRKNLYHSAYPQFFVTLTRGRCQSILRYFLHFELPVIPSVSTESSWKLSYSSAYQAPLLVRRSKVESGKTPNFMFHHKNNRHYHHVESGLVFGVVFPPISTS